MINDLWYKNAIIYCLSVGAYMDADGEHKLAAIETRELKAGDVLRIARSGGAGCGSPLERDAEAVWRDVQDGYVSLAAARERYGVVLDPVSLEIDQAATAALRRR